MSTSSTTAAMTIAASVASGSFSNSPVSKSRVTSVRAAAVIEETCDLAPAAPFTAVLERLPLTTIPPVTPAPRLPRRVRAAPGWCRCRSPPAAYVLAAPRPSAKPTSMTPTRAPSSSRKSAPLTSGRPSDGSPESMVPTMSSPSSSRPRTVTAAIPAAATTSEPGTGGAQRRRASSGARLTQPDRRRQRLRVAEVAQQVPALLEEVAAALVDADQRGQLSDHDRQGESDDEALEDGFGDERRQEAQAQEAGDQGGHARGERERRSEGDELGRVVGDTRDDTQGQRRGRRHRRDHEVTRRPEQCVQHERGHRGVQADHRWHPGDGRVGERLRDQHRPDRQARDHIGTQPRRLEAFERRCDQPRALVGPGVTGPGGRRVCRGHGTPSSCGAGRAERRSARRPTPRPNPVRHEGRSRT